MIIADINQVKVVAYDKVVEYFRVDKKLGGLIKVFVSVDLRSLGRTVEVIAPDLDSRDVVKVNGVVYVPQEEK